MILGLAGAYLDRHPSHLACLDRVGEVGHRLDILARVI
jgi:hypothetical protein